MRLQQSGEKEKSRNRMGKRVRLPSLFERKQLIESPSTPGYSSPTINFLFFFDQTGHLKLTLTRRCLQIIEHIIFCYYFTALLSDSSPIKSKSKRLIMLVSYTWTRTGALTDDTRLILAVNARGKCHHASSYTSQPRLPRLLPPPDLRSRFCHLS